jgi:hypothetical protein
MAPMIEQIDRRRFIAGITGSLIGLSVFPTQAEANSATPTALTPLTGDSKRPRHSNINVSVGDFYKDHKFINCAKAGSRIIRDIQSGGGGTSEWYQDINADHYPTESQVGVTFYVNLNGQTTYIVKWRGMGAVTGSSMGSKQNAAKGIWTGGGADGRIVENGRFAFAGGNSQNSFSVRGPTITDLVICRADEEAVADAGHIFRQQYIDLIKSYDGVLRFSVGPDYTNRNVLVNWSDRPQTTLMTYNGGRYYLGKKLGHLMGNGAYNSPGYAGMPGNYTSGETVHFSVAQDSSLASCTLDVGARGPKPVVNEYLLALDTAGSNAATRLLAGANYTATYDATLGCWIFTPQYPTVGHPLEVMIAECNATGCPGWFSIPFNASDDYVKKYGQLFCDTYKHDTLYVEYANEVWNYAYGFPMTARAARYGSSFFGLSGGNNANISGWYGYRFRQIADILRNVFAVNGQSAKLKMIFSSQGASGDSVSSLQTVIENTRFQNKSVPALSGTSAPITRADVVSYALYYAGQTTKSSDAGWSMIADKVKGPLKIAVDQFMSGNAKEIATAFVWMTDDFLTSEVSIVNGRFTNWNALASRYNKEVRLYECNHQILAPSAAWCMSNLGDASYGNTPTTAGKIQQFLNAFLASANYEGVVLKYLQDFYTLSQSAGFSLFGFATPQPWLVFPKSSQPDTSGDSFNAPFGNWRANAAWNKSH